MFSDSEIKFNAPQKRPLRIGTVQHVDADTGIVLSEEHNVGMLMPCAANVCQECATDHPHDHPHNQESLHYQYAFYAKHGRWPTWLDAVAHVPEPQRELWLRALVKLLKDCGKEIPEELLNLDENRTTR
jgi:hypothetical protein